jgi:hypothetical protein
MHSPQVRVVGPYRELLPFSGADDKDVVGLNNDYTPELIDDVRVRVAVWCGLDVPGIRTGPQRVFLLTIDDDVTGPEASSHVILL